MKANVTIIILILCVIKLVAQNKLESSNSDLNKLFYNLPIDSCIGYIKNQIQNLESIKVINIKDKINISNTEDQTYRILYNENINADSIEIELVYWTVPIGGFQGSKAVDYEQYLDKIVYFENYSNANEFILKTNNQLDSMYNLLRSNYKENENEIEWQYCFTMGNNKDIPYHDLFLTFYREKNKVNIRYRTIYNYNKCN